jgi:hypothetical protein
MGTYIKTIFAMLALLLVGQVGWLLMPGRTSLMEGQYRGEQRIAAFKRYTAEPTESNRKILDDEIELNMRHRFNVKLTVFFSVSFVELLFAIYLIRKWRPGARANEADSSMSGM